LKIDTYLIFISLIRTVPSITSNCSTQCKHNAAKSNPQARLAVACGEFLLVEELGIKDKFVDALLYDVDRLRF
jgi:hypothetical protein